LDTRHLQGFVKIAETGSISRAAVSLAISQPSLSQQLMRLEEEVGTPLLRRTSRGVLLTEAGRIFLEHARQIIAGTEQALEHVRQLSEPSGAVTLAVPYSISKLAGVRLVEAFAEHAPQVSFRLVEANTGQIRGWLDESKIDLGILHGEGPFRNLTVRTLASEELFLIGPAGAYGPSTRDMPAVQLDELAGMPMILPGPQHGLRQTVEQTAARLGVTIVVAHELDAMTHVAGLVARGRGHSILPHIAIADDLAAGKVSIARIGQGVFRRTLSLARNNTQLVTHASVRAEDLSAKVLARLIAKGEWRAEPAEGLHCPAQIPADAQGPDSGDET
jgi:LysR family transcriptional regulator, nitrogen assimilation regulatory protein